MRPLFLLLFLLISFNYISAQNKAPEYVDVVSLKGGKELVGTVVEYIHEEKVVMVLENGDLKEIPGDEIRRVNFRLDKYRLQSIKRKTTQLMVEEQEEAEVFIPTRKRMHQLTGAVNIGQSSVSRFGNSRTFGGSFAYHIVQEVKFLKVGLGVDVSMMSESRNENVAAITSFAESAFSINGGRLRPLIRFEFGPSLPFGDSGSGDEIIRRDLSFLFHPSIGVEIAPRKGQWGGLVFDLGYRFLDSNFTILTSNLDELERTVNYRRLVFRGGLRF